MIAIIIPFFKLTFFEATLKSLARQTDKRFKVYIGDDASTEDCSSLLHQFEGQFDFKYQRFETNLGSFSLTQQWERCIDLLGNEEWLMILGDDDVLENNVIASFYQNLNEVKQKKINVIRFACEVIDENGIFFLGPYLHPKLESAADFYIRKVKNQTRSSLSEYIFKKKTFKKYCFVNYPLAWHSDDKAWLDFSENKPILTINNALVYVRVSEINISGRQDNFKQKLNATNQFFKDVLKNNYKQFTQNQLLDLLLAYEEIVKKQRKLKGVEWSFLCKYYLRYFCPIPFLKFIRRLIISNFK